ncbi:ImmA/IrrE family metallo-endopeptidase [Streptomyces werraensis]|uniref:ImmA/IrrE family metallo-endopeptidase n=1 Tax=Streptomyces werraensis TaxID=68284 RepID=A0ABV3JGI0_9ACTN|nr:ImmA/IrrE family metallo-endopeptidase [Streptomyces sp. NRRL S-1314]WTC18665.1 ImmA/IrrE family metallo-endopeptidase [Streptomyces cellulosae]
MGFTETEPVEDLTGLVESLGVPVEYRNLPAKVHGISVPEKWEDRVSWVVIINSGDVWSRQRFTLAHELCHVLQNDPGQVIVDRAQMQEARPERIANSFARHFLLPEDALQDKLHRCGKISTKEQAAALVSDVILTHGVSRDATMIALGEVAEGEINTSIIEFCRTAAVGELMRMSGNSAAWDELNATRWESFPSERLSQQVLDAYAEQLVSLQTVADVISDGSVEDARLQLREAGWNVDQPTSR